MAARRRHCPTLNRHVLIQQQVPQTQQVGHEVLLPVADKVLPAGGPRIAGPVAVELLLAAGELIGTGDAPHRQRRRARGRNFHRCRRRRFGGRVRRVGRRQLVRGAVHRGRCRDRQLLKGGRDGGRRSEAAGQHEVFIFFRFFSDVHTCFRSLGGGARGGGVISGDSIHYMHCQPPHSRSVVDDEVCL